MVVIESKPDADKSCRQALVEAAFYAIAVKGFKGLRLHDGATKVGINHSTLHPYFSTKEDLVAGVVEYATRLFKGQRSRNLD